MSAPKLTKDSSNTLSERKETLADPEQSNPSHSISSHASYWSSFNAQEPQPPLPNRKTLSQKINAFERLMRLDKPIGIFLLLWPTLIAVWIASYRQPDIFFVFLFVVGTIVMRSAGCIVNDCWDRNYDGQVWRTYDRPIAKGEISLYEACVLCLILLAAAFAILYHFDSPSAYWLAAFGVLLTFVYPLGKRYFVAPQALLGIAFSLGIPIVFAAQFNHIASIAWWVFGINFFYVFAYDTAYAMADRQDDLKLGLKSSAIWLGRADVSIIMLCYSLYLMGMAWLYYHLAWHHKISLLFFILALACLIDQWRLIRHRNPQQCFVAFRRSHWISFFMWLSLWQWPPI